MAITKKIYLVDTCSYVLQFNNPRYGALLDEWIVNGQFVLSSIVAMELYAGTANKKAKQALDQLSAHLISLALIAIPTFQDYQRAGILLKNYSQRKGRTPVSPHFRDVLIALSATRINATIVTENTEDFLRWKKEIQRSFQKDLIIQSGRDFL